MKVALGLGFYWSPRVGRRLMCEISDARVADMQFVTNDRSLSALSNSIIKDSSRSGSRSPTFEPIRD
jgi:hypothetical protein